MAILEEIFNHQRRVVARQQQACPLPEMQAAAREAPPALDFVCALRESALRDSALRDAGLGAVPSRPALIAEIKRRSPSRGLLIGDFDPLHLARLYAENGAAAISVLTEEDYFGGHLDHLRTLAASRVANSPSFPHLPLLRKDFICDPYQVYQSRAAGADAVLLIVAGLQPDLLRELYDLVVSMQMTPLVEVHSMEELRTALALKPVLVGINNRDLRDFTVKLETTLQLRPYIPPGVKVVSESGIHTGQDVVLLAEAGVDAILVGEALVTAEDIAGMVRRLARQPARQGAQEGGNT